jgi:hypothetical protein
MNDERRPLLPQNAAEDGDDVQQMQSSISIALDPSASAFNVPAIIPEENAEAAASSVSIAPVLRPDR